MMTTDAVPKDMEHLFRVYVIYAHPKDFPDGYVVRVWFVRRGEVEPRAGLAAGAPTLATARDLLPADLTRLAPDPADDPAIAEVWI